MKMRGLTIITAMGLICAAPTAATAQVPEALYSDVKDVIEELLTAEIAESVVPQLACQGGREILFEAKASDPAYIDLDTPEGRNVRLLTLLHFPRSLQTVYSRQFGGLRSSIMDESADFAGYVVYEGLTSANSKSANGSTSIDKAAQSPIVAKVAGVELPSTPNAPGAAQDSPTLSFAPLNSDAVFACATEMKGRFKQGKFVSKRTTPLDERCSRDGTDSTQSFKCDIAFAVRAEVQGKPQIAQEWLIRAAALIVGDAVAVNLGLRVDETTRAREILTVAMRDAIANNKISPTEFTKQLEDDLREVLCQADDTRNFCANPAGIRDALAEVLSAISRLRVQWGLVSSQGTQNVDVASFATVLASADGALSKICSDDVTENPPKRKSIRPEVCAVYRQTKSVLGRTKELWPIVRAASQGDAREAAHIAVTTMFHLGESSDPMKDVYLRFAESVALYVIDSSGGKAPDEGTRGAFKSATEDLIRTVSGPSGFSRPWWTPTYIPSFALRASWNPAYVNHDTGSFRTLASVSILGIRAPIRYTNLTYLALDFSFLDPLAPLAELAIRDNQNADYARQPRLIANAITPRIDLLVGVPALSQHLALGAGASLRLVAPILVSREINQNSTFTHYDYGWVTQDAGYFSRFVEFGFFAKYLL